MSIQTWMREFYKKEAYDAISSDRVALKHAILKWSGLTKSNLKKHGVEKKSNRVDIHDKVGGIFSMSGDSCSLCEMYAGRSDCYGCPIVISTERKCYTGKIAPTSYSKKPAIQNP